MTTKEMHLLLDLYLQKLNSHYNKNIVSEEKDTIINIGILRFIKNRVNPASNVKGLGLDQTIKRLEDLNPLIEKVSLDVYYNGDNCFVELPYNYLYYIDSTAFVKCSKEPETSTKTVYISSLNKITKSLSTSNLKISYKTDNKDLVLFNASDLPDNYIDSSTIYKEPMDFIINNAIFIKISNKLEELIFNKTINENELEFTYNTSAGIFQFRSNSMFTITVEEDSTISNKVATPENKNFLIGNATLKATCEFKERDFFSKVTSNYLSSSPQHKIINRYKNTIEFNDVDDYKPHKLELVYIKRPKQVSLLLDSDSDLPRVTLEEIMADVDRNLKGLLSMDSYDKTLNEFTFVE